jgi:hypothetical protein
LKVKMAINNEAVSPWRPASGTKMVHSIQIFQVLDITNF